MAVTAECYNCKCAVVDCTYYVFVKVVVQPAASADLSGVVFSLSNPNVSSQVTDQKRTLQFLQIINCSF